MYFGCILPSCVKDKVFKLFLTKIMWNNIINNNLRSFISFGNVLNKIIYYRAGSSESLIFRT